MTGWLIPAGKEDICSIGQNPVHLPFGNKMSARMPISEQRKKQVAWLDFSRCDYLEMHHLQKHLHARRQRQEIPDLVIALEHLPCITLGR
ncbi:MAG: hypothetical protein CSB34_07565, partial [Desulfobulbus propionicus]